jgi:hypothetical protein
MHRTEKGCLYASFISGINCSENGGAIVWMWLIPAKTHIEILLPVCQYWEIEPFGELMSFS